MGAYSTIPSTVGNDNPGDNTPSRSSRTEDDILNGDSQDAKDQPLLPGLTKDLEKELIGLVSEFERESYSTWRWQVRDVYEAESFWKDLQIGFFDARNDLWRTPSIKQLSNVGESGQRFNFFTNIYKAFGWALISVLGQKVPSTRFLPQDYRRESDVIAARAAADVVPLICRNNKAPLLNLRAIYCLYTGGIVASYTRYLEDGSSFGWKDEPDIQMQKVKMAEAGFECPGCHQFTAVDDVHPAEQTLQNGCPNCMSPINDLNFSPPQFVDAPVVSSVKKVPRGQELITLHGVLETRLPPWVQEQRDMPYLGLVHEVHISQLKATYGDRAKNLQGGYGSGPYDTWDRFARLALIEPTVSYYSTSNQNLVTFKRYWLRPDAFYMVENDTKDKEGLGKRDQLLKLFPDGAYIAFADPTYLLDARNERLDDHWRICRAMEGAGMYTPSLGSSSISVQKRYNTLHNFIMEWVEYAAAGTGTFVNANHINVRALSNQRKAPGNIYPIRVPAGSDISRNIYEARPGAIANEVFKYADSLQELGQFMTSAVPTVTGGTQQSLKPTTYLADREQALGRLYVPWLHLRTFWADTIGLAVKEFARWRTEDEQYSVFGPRGDAQGLEIRLEDLQGNFDAYPETDEAFPVLWQQMQAAFMQLMQSADPRIQEILGSTENIAFAKSMLGLPDIYVPGEDDRIKQKQEIALLLQGAPVQTTNPQTGAMELLPSVPIDPFEDMHPIHIEGVKAWAVSAVGLRAKVENPNGYHNVIAHGVAHEKFVMIEQAQAEGGALMQGRQLQPHAKPDEKQGSPPAVQAGSKGSQSPIAQTKQGMSDATGGGSPQGPQG